MAILFFEGLPGAGKSYEAMVTQIIPALQKGREVVAYIEGLNVERIAEASGLGVDDVRQLLHPLTRDQMRPGTSKVGRKDVPIDGDWLTHVRDNALHVFDEAQSWWGLRWRASESLTEFVSEHRHRGMDILLMGQSLKDVMPLWRRRVDQKFGFLKLTALGTSKRYRVTIFKGQGDDKFVKVTTKVGKYDPKFFGTYSSHTSTDINTETYTDSRVRLWGSWAFRFGVPVLLGLALWGAMSLRSYFHPAPLPKKAVFANASPMLPIGSQSVQLAPASAPAPAVKKGFAQQYVADLNSKGRIRLAGVMSFRGHTGGVVEWIAGSQVIERIGLDQLRAIGVDVKVIDDVVLLSAGDWEALATSWPTDPPGMVSERDQRAIAGGERSGGGGMYTRQEVVAVDSRPDAASFRSSR